MLAQNQKLDSAADRIDRELCRRAGELAIADRRAAYPYPDDDFDAALDYQELRLCHHYAILRRNRSK